MLVYDFKGAFNIKCTPLQKWDSGSRKSRCKKRVFEYICGVPFFAGMGGTE